MTIENESKPIHCVGVICFRGEDVLLIRRGTAPRKGEWSIPGGRIERGETEVQAAQRELLEETGVQAGHWRKIINLQAHFEGVDYILHDYLALWQSGEPKPADDAAEAIFVSPNMLVATPMWEKTREVIDVARAEMHTLKNSIGLEA